jgi:hypothetical protein
VAEGRALRLEIGELGDAVEWDLEALAATADGEARAFTLPAGLDPGRWELARILSGALDDGLLVAVAGLRPVGAGGHGDESVGGAVIRDGAVTVLDEALMSVERDGAGTIRRVGLELYEAPDSLPLRIAGDAKGGSSPDDAVLALRSGSARGLGRLAIVRAR